MKLRLFLLSLIAFPILLLSSCTGLRAADPGPLTDFWTLAETFSAEMAVTAEATGRSTAFRMRCAYADDVCTVKLLEPEELSDVTVTLDEDGVSLGLENTMILAGELSDLSPATIFGELIRVWKYGGIEEYGAETYEGTPCILLTTRQEGHIFRTLFAEETKLPIWAEIYNDGVRVMTCTFTNPAAESAADS